MTPHFLSSYLPFSLKLAAKSRQGGGNMFRHQMGTLAILLEYGYTEPILLKAALIHDLVEDGGKVGFHALEEIAGLDEDGPEVLALVKVVSRKVIAGVKEPKSEFLLRIMDHGSDQAKTLKLADRISNLSALILAENKDFVKSDVAETEVCLMPFADTINPDMAKELKNRIELIHKFIQNGNT